MIAINESWRMCPTADVLYAADAQWWTLRGPKPREFSGERLAARYVVAADGRQRTDSWAKHPEVQALGVEPINVKTGGGIAPPGSDFVCTGHNSAYQAMGLAILWGSRRIAFLGLDMTTAKDGRAHWHDDHAEPLRNPHHANKNGQTTLDTFKAAFAKSAPALSNLHVTVLNCSRRTALHCFPQVPLEEAFP